MAGRPTEVDDNNEAPADLLLALKKATTDLRLSLGVSSFVPMPYTPFQREPVRPEAEKRPKRLKPKGIELRPESYRWSVIQPPSCRARPPPTPWQAVIQGRWETDWVLPWGHLEGPLPRSTLARHRQEALTAAGPAVAAAWAG